MFAERDPIIRRRNHIVLAVVASTLLLFPAWLGPALDSDVGLAMFGIASATAACYFAAHGVRLLAGLVLGYSSAPWYARPKGLPLLLGFLAVFDTLFVTVGAFVSEQARHEPEWGALLFGGNSLILLWILVLDWPAAYPGRKEH